MGMPARIRMTYAQGQQMDCCVVCSGVFVRGCGRAPTVATVWWRTRRRQALIQQTCSSARRPAYTEQDGKTAGLVLALTETALNNVTPRRPWRNACYNGAQGVHLVQEGAVVPRARACKMPVAQRGVNTEKRGNVAIVAKEEKVKYTIYTEKEGKRQSGSTPGQRGTTVF